MTSCSAINCKSRFTKNEDISFHSFPKEEKRRDLWIRAVRRENWQPSRASKLCSKHFREEDIDRTSLNCVRLREHAVPTIFSSWPSLRKAEVTDRGRTHWRRTQTSASKHLQERTEQCRESLQAVTTGNSSRFIPSIFSKTKSGIQARWTMNEDTKLKELVKKYGNEDWNRIASFLPNRTEQNCQYRWEKVVNLRLKMGPWTKEEDEMLRNRVKICDNKKYKKWVRVAESLPGRTGKQCRERWHNYLDPKLKKTAWALKEEKLICNFIKKYGKRWSKMAKLLPGRSENVIKNHWYCNLKRKMKWSKQKVPENASLREILLHHSSSDSSVQSSDCQKDSIPSFQDHNYFPMLENTDAESRPVHSETPVAVFSSSQSLTSEVNPDQAPDIYSASSNTAREMWDDLTASQANTKNIPHSVLPEHKELDYATPNLSLNFKTEAVDSSKSSVAKPDTLLDITNASVSTMEPSETVGRFACDDGSSKITGVHLRLQQKEFTVNAGHLNSDLDSQNRKYLTPTHKGSGTQAVDSSDTYCNIMANLDALLDIVNASESTMKTSEAVDDLADVCQQLQQTGSTNNDDQIDAQNKDCHSVTRKCSGTQAVDSSETYRNIIANLDALMDIVNASGSTMETSKAVNDLADVYQQLQQTGSTNNDGEIDAQSKDCHSVTRKCLYPRSDEESNSSTDSVLGDVESFPETKSVNEPNTKLHSWTKDKMKFFITYKSSSRIIQLEEERNIYDAVSEIYGLEKGSYFLQRFDKEFEEFVDLEHEKDLQDKDKIRIQDIYVQLQISTVENMSSNSLRFSSELMENVLARSRRLKYKLSLKEARLPSDIVIPVQDFSMILRETLENKFSLNWDCSRELVAHLARFMYKFNPYPTKLERQKVCLALVAAYPHLKTNIGLGIEGWELKLLNKLKKMRQKDQSMEVSTVRAAVSSSSKTPNRICPVRKAGQINWAPDHFPGENEESQGFHLKCLKKEAHKKERDEQKVTTLMDLTFSFRRQLINENAPVARVIELYPSFFDPKQQQEEFKRLTAIELQLFYNNAVAIGPKLFQLFKQKKRTAAEEETLNFFNCKIQDLSPQQKYLAEACVGVYVLPFLLKEPLASFFLTVDDDSDTPLLGHPILLGKDPLEEDFTIVIEGLHVRTLKDFLKSAAVLVSFFYTLNIAYPTELKNTYKFFELNFLNIKEGCIPAKVTTLTKKIKT